MLPALVTLESLGRTLIVDMDSIPLDRAGGLMQQPDTPRVVDTESPRHTPFEHEITADPTEFQSAGTVEAEVAGIWTVRAGTVAYVPALPRWMTVGAKRV